MAKKFATFHGTACLGVPLSTRNGIWASCNQLGRRPRGMSWILSGFVSSGLSP